MSGRRGGGWVWVSTTYYTCQLDFDERGRIVKAAPIIRWAVGRDVHKFKEYLAGRGILRGWEEYGNGK